DDVSYLGATDTTGGSDKDRFTLAIGHLDGSRIVQDVIRGHRGRRGGAVDLEGIVREYCQILKTYRCPRVMGDKYSAVWVRQAFARECIHYLDAIWTASQAFNESRALFVQGLVDLLDHPEQVREWKRLEQRPGKDGKPSIAHPPGGHDDYANSFALCCAQLVQHAAQAPFFFS